MGRSAAQLQGKEVGVDAFTIAKSNSVNFEADTSNNPKAHKFARVYVGGAGNVVLVTAAGSTVTFTSVAAGTLLPVLAIRVNSTDTTASLMTGIVSL